MESVCSQIRTDYIAIKNKHNTDRVRTALIFNCKINLRWQFGKEQSLHRADPSDLKQVKHGTRMVFCEVFWSK